jgi:hypothetical protein
MEGSGNHRRGAAVHLVPAGVGEVDETTAHPASRVTADEAIRTA